MKLVKRSDLGWGSSNAYAAKPRAGLVIHYDGSNQGLAGKPHSACRDYWVRTRRFHTGPSRRWSDIGYSFGACPHGYVFEGRGLNHVQAAQPGGNSTWYSCTLMGGPREKPTAEQIEAVRELRAYLMARGVAGAVKGHRDFFSTSCPGGILYDLVKDGTFAKPPSKGGPADPVTKPKPANWTEVLVDKLPLLKPGAKGWHVKTVTHLLAARGYPIGEGLDDTVLSPEVADRLAEFQEASGLKADRICGELTWGKLLKVS